MQKFAKDFDNYKIFEEDSFSFRYYDKRELTGSVYERGKQDYSEKHGVPYILQNKRPFKLKDSLKELEQTLSSHKLVFSDWRCDNIIQFIFSTGLIVNIWVDIHNGSITRIIFDKFLVGKLLSENISDGKCFLFFLIQPSLFLMLFLCFFSVCQQNSYHNYLF